MSISKITQRPSDVCKIVALQFVKFVIGTFQSNLTVLVICV